MIVERQTVLSDESKREREENGLFSENDRRVFGVIWRMNSVKFGRPKWVIGGGRVRLELPTWKTATERSL